MKNVLFACLLFFGGIVNAQTLATPEQFLGYELGDRFTPHYKVAAYFEAIAAAAPQLMKFEKYGSTTEGRPLYIAVLSSPENFSRTEEIRKNNLRLTGLINDQPAAARSPAIVWLSYNVHGNEASSSEAAMKVLYEIVSRKNMQLNEWLKNIVVIIDPCLNPDGRDRYVNWITQTTGKVPNADPAAREHDEPWPGGRSNHYNFDLNRDWVWQTQTESQQRLIKYRQWMPQIHCDFHEMGPNDPYYFAPGAEPVHEAVTQWQKDFQVTVGKNHAKYFDANGWLYFTKQYYDLLYPSYGDTYPLLNGAIGMTYEQGGGPRSGLQYAMKNADTLMLTDRIAHHFATSMSTIEIASLNAVKLVSAFKKYFEDARAGNIGTYKTYVISNKNESSIAPLKELLKKNNIEFGFATETKSAKGFNYFSLKEETFSVQKNDLLISSAQPEAALLGALFEPSSKIHDSATYDITAWALPYAFGLQTYGMKENMASQKAGAANTKGSVNANAYGYIIPYHSFNDSKVLASLLKEGIKIRFAESAFSFNGIKYDAGSLIILRKGNEDKIGNLLSAATGADINVVAISSGFMESGFDFGSDKLHLMKKPKVAALTGTGASTTAAGEVWHLFDEQLDYPLTLLNAERFNAGDLASYDVLIIADGYYKFLSAKDDAADLKAWIKNGGKLIVMENAAKQVAGLDWGLKMKSAPEEKNDTASLYSSLRKYADREKESLTGNIPGAIYKLQLDNTHPLGYGYPDFYYSLKMNDNAFEFLNDGWNVAVIKKQKEVSGFVGSRVKENLKDGTLIGEVPMGRGSVVFLTDDPLFRSFWETGKMLFCNAVFFAGQ